MGEEEEGAGALHQEEKQEQYKGEEEGAGENVQQVLVPVRLQGMVLVVPRGWGWHQVGCSFGPAAAVL